MIRFGAALVAAAVLGSTIPVDAMAVTKPRFGVFGRINGKNFKAKNLNDPLDPCVSGIFTPGQGVLTFAALECKSKRRRQGNVKKNYKSIVMACANFDMTKNPLTPPFEIPCAASVYSETKTGRFRQPLSTTQWGADFQLPIAGSPTSSVHLRVTEFDGSVVRGVISGVFNVSIQGAASTVPAPIEGEVTFEFPFRVQ